MARAFTERTAWARNLAAPVRDFLNTESSGAVALLAAALAALAWSNSPWSDSYESCWTTDLSIMVGDHGISLPVRGAIGGMAVAVLIYLARNAGAGGAHGWGVAMSTDTAFALGVLSLVAPG